MGGEACAHPPILRAYVAAAPWRRRSDDNAPVRPKMLYASSKDALKKALTGINDEFQATECASRLIVFAGCLSHSDHREPPS